MNCYIQYNVRIKTALSKTLRLIHNSVGRMGGGHFNMGREVVSDFGNLREDQL